MTRRARIRPVWPPMDKKDLEIILKRMVARASIEEGVAPPKLGTVKKCILTGREMFCDFKGVYIPPKNRVVLKEEYINQCVDRLSKGWSIRSIACEDLLGTLAHEIRHYKQHLEKGGDAWRDLDKPWEERPHEQDASKIKRKAVKCIEARKHPVACMKQALTEPLTY